MSDYTPDNSDYERLQRENERLKAERELAVRVALFFHYVAPQILEALKATGHSDQMLVRFEDGTEVTYDDVRKVLAWYREAQNTEKGGE